MFSNTKKQIVIKVESVRELIENLPKCRYNDNSDLTVVLLITKKNYYIFLETSGSKYRVKRKMGESYDWNRFTSDVERISDDEFETMCNDLRNEIVDDLAID
jgi:hypothetical protein